MTSQVNDKSDDSTDFETYTELRFDSGTLQYIETADEVDEVRVWGEYEPVESFEANRVLRDTVEGFLSSLRSTDGFVSEGVYARTQEGFEDGHSTEQTLRLLGVDLEFILDTVPELYDVSEADSTGSRKKDETAVAQFSGHLFEVDVHAGNLDGWAEVRITFRESTSNPKFVA